MPFARANTQTFTRTCQLQRRTGAAPSRAQVPTRTEAEIPKIAAGITIGTGAEEEIETGVAKEARIKAVEVAEAVEARTASAIAATAEAVVVSAKAVATGRTHKIAPEESLRLRNQASYRRS